MFILEKMYYNQMLRWQQTLDSPSAFTVIRFQVTSPIITDKTIYDYGTRYIYKHEAPSLSLGNTQFQGRDQHKQLAM